MTAARVTSCVLQTLTLSSPCRRASAGRNRLGTQVGLATQGPSAALAEEDILSARHLGRRVASLTLRMRAGNG